MMNPVRAVWDWAPVWSPTADRRTREGRQRSSAEAKRDNPAPTLNINAM